MEVLGHIWRAELDKLGPVSLHVHFDYEDDSQSSSCPGLRAEGPSDHCRGSGL